MNHDKLTYILKQRRSTLRQQVDPIEWAAREDLAACYRLCVHYVLLGRLSPNTS